MAGSDITIEILKDIRVELRGVNSRLDGVDRGLEGIDKRLDVIDDRVELVSQRLDITNQRLDVVESTLLTVARRQRSLVRYCKANTTGLSRLEGRVDDLEARDKLEKR